MGEPFRFLLLGLGAGALYALVALGIVLIYRGSGVVNFAQGAMGMVGTYVFYELRDQSGWPVLLALLVGILASAATGVLTHYLVMRPLRGASNLTRVIATLGVLAVLQGGAALQYPYELLIVRPFLPHDGMTVFGAHVGEDRMIILVLVIVLAITLWALYRYSRFGIATTACAENARGGAALGLSADAIAAMNWGLGAGLAGLAGILLAPITGLQVTQLTLIVIPSLAAAVAGNMASFPITVAAALLIGATQAEITRYVSTPGWGAAVPFVLVAVVLVVRGRTVVGKGEQAARLPSIGTGRVRLSVVVPVVLVVLAALWLWLPLNWIDAVNTQLIFAVLLLSIVVVVGYAGQLSLAQFAFAGLGALFAGRLVDAHGLPFELALIVGGLVTIPAGIVIGLIGVRTRGVNLAIITLGFAVALESVIFRNPKYTGGPAGTQVPNQSIFGVDLDTVTHPERYGTLVLAVLLILSVAVANLRRGRVGRRMIAVRSNERAAASLGISVIGVKVFAFSLAGVIAGVGGVLLAFRNPSIEYTQFSVFRSIFLVQEAVIGGVGWLAGPPIGATLEPGSIGSRLFDFLGDDVATYLFVIGGVLLILTLIHARDGLAAMSHEMGKKVLEHVRKAPRVQDARASGTIRHTVVPKSLVVRDLSVRLGGVSALSGLSLRVDPGEVVGLIGPNGAGKTTALDAITGFVTPQSGTIEVGGERVNHWSRERRARAGLGRSFQDLQLFDDMTVLENMQAASEPRNWSAYLTDLVLPGKLALTPAATAAIQEFRLGDELEVLPERLSYGQRRLVGIARSVAAEPSVILLDEPAAGLDDVETAELGELIRRLSSEWGMAVLLVEHDVELVMKVCDRIYALNFGFPIGEGTPEEIRNDPTVVSAYLGDPSGSGETAPTPS